MLGVQLAGEEGDFGRRNLQGGEQGFIGMYEYRFKHPPTSHKPETQPLYTIVSAHLFFQTHAKTENPL